MRSRLSPAPSSRLPPSPPTPCSQPLSTGSPIVDLHKRTCAFDVIQCPRCPGRMHVLAYISDPEFTAETLEHLGLPCAPPRLAPARDPPQLDLAG